MSNKFVEHESKRCSKRKRGFSHYRKKNPVAKAPKLDEDDLSDTDYYFENGLRKVYPYFYNFSTYVKGRWLGRTIYDVFTNEFRGVHSFQETIDNGLLSVNGKPVKADFVLQNHQFIEHKTHRHENPVIAAPLEILHDSPDLLVINKPSSLPVHPCGRYRYNSITMLLAKEYGYKNLRTLYRLDRLTSGVLLLPKTTAMSVKLEKQLASKQLLKEYVCRVEGEFPEGPIECQEKIGVISVRMGVQAIRPDGKESHTTFTRISYNGRSSVVKCVPYTGRTHQIRVHLQYLGYPILNDPVYNSTAFGPEKGKGGKVDKSVEELEAILGRWHNSSEWILGDNPDYQRKFGTDKTNTDTSDSATSKVHSCDMEVTNQQTSNSQTETGKDNVVSNHEVESKKVSESEINQDKDDKLSCVTADESAPFERGKDNVISSNKMESDKVCVTETTGETGGNLSYGSTGESEASKQVESCEADGGESPTGKKSDSSEAAVLGGDTATTQGAVSVESWERHVASRPLDKARYTLERSCHICRSCYKEPTARELILFLHAVRYKGPDWEYSTPPPDWARQDWDQEDQYAVTENSS